MDNKNTLKQLALRALAGASLRTSRTDGAAFLSWARERFGARTAIKALFSARSTGEHAVASVPVRGKWVPKGAERRIGLRCGTTDNSVYDQVFGEEEYRLDYRDPKFIIDAGAHIGSSSLYFAMRFPNARIVSIEPELGNWSLAKANLAQFPNVTVVRGALWSHRTAVGIVNASAESWGFRVVEDPLGEHCAPKDNGLPINGFTISDVMQRIGVERIDILKMDIEGSEVEVLPTVPMDKVGALLCETHDRFKPGCVQAVRSATPHWAETMRGHTHILTPPSSARG